MNAKGDGKCSPEHKQTMTQRECPLVAKLGTPTTDCDITLPLKSSFQTLHKKSRKFRREVKRRWIRGRDGGPGPCNGRGIRDSGRAECQDGAGRAVGQGRAGRAGGQGGPGRAGSKGEANNHLNVTNMTNRPPNDTIMTAKKSTKCLITASTAATEWTDNSAMVFLTKTGQADSSTVSLAVTGQADWDFRSGRHRPERSWSRHRCLGRFCNISYHLGRTGAGSGVDSWTGTISGVDSWTWVSSGAQLRTTTPGPLSRVLQDHRTWDHRSRVLQDHRTWDHQSRLGCPPSRPSPADQR